MDPFLVLLHSVSTGLSSSELTDIKFLCQDRVSKKKLERVQSGLDLFSVLLEQSELDPHNPELLRELLVSLRRQDLLRLLDEFQAGATRGAAPGEQGGRAAPARVGSVGAGTGRGQAPGAGPGGAEPVGRELTFTRLRWPGFSRNNLGRQVTCPLCRGDSQNSEK